MRYSNCVHGQAAPAIIVNALDWFTAEYEEHVFQRRCRARTCRGLVRYQIDSDALAAHPEFIEGLAEAADLCPTNAVKQINGSYLIDDALCVRCNVCREVAPQAVQVVDAFAGVAGAAPELISVQPAER